MLFTDSSSFTTSHDDDSDVGCERERERERACLAPNSAPADELVIPFNSSGEWFRQTFTSWQKGDVLGNGSFGTVYEGFTE